MSRTSDFIATLTPEEQKGVHKYNAFRTALGIAGRKARIRREVESIPGFPVADIEAAVEALYRLEMTKQGELGGRPKKEARHGNR